eukprot:EC097447.1.p3 GENE.EC097447.1~~EC097447.1.p3  ORF type:complete len:118 (-),score=8.41 EC097447.1:321-674(-)
MQHTNTYVQQYSDTTQQKKQTPQKITASIIKNISMKTFAFLLTRKKECTISITSPHIFIEKHIKKNSTIVTKNCIVTLSMIQKYQYLQYIVIYKKFTMLNLSYRKYVTYQYLCLIIF